MNHFYISFLLSFLYHEFSEKTNCFPDFCVFLYKAVSKTEGKKIREGKSPFSGEFFLSLSEKQKIPDEMGEFCLLSGWRILSGYGFAES